MEWNASVGIPLIVLGAIVLLLIYVFGRPKKPEQGERRPARRSGGEQERVEPTFGDPDALPTQGELEVSQVDAFDARDIPPSVRSAARSAVGKRPEQSIERIVTLFVSARPGEMIAGSDVVVAAEKAGLEFGDMGIYHRLVDGHPEQGPIFSVANLTKPGNFDMGRIATLQTSGLSFFMALPGPAPALDAWDAMLPTAQRLAELLDGLVLDEERNALGRQRIAHIRDELRGWDRGHEGEEIKFGQ
jgi:cell division protein ZipA